MLVGYVVFTSSHTVEDKRLFHGHMLYTPNYISHNVYFIKSGEIETTYPSSKDSLHLHPLLLLTLPPQALLPMGQVG